MVGSQVTSGSVWGVRGVWHKVLQSCCSPCSQRCQSTSRHSQRSRPGLPLPRLAGVTKIHQATVLAHHFCFSIAAGCGTNTFKIHTANISSAECKHSATVEGPAVVEAWGGGVPSSCVTPPYKRSPAHPIRLVPTTRPIAIYSTGAPPHPTSHI